MTKDRSFPDAADGRRMPPMADELMLAGLSSEDARFVASQLRRGGYYLVRPDEIGWPEIKAFRDELRRGHGIGEDAGGYFVRAIMALFGRKPDQIETIKDAARRLIVSIDDDRTKGG